MKGHTTHYLEVEENQAVADTVEHGFIFLLKQATPSLEKYIKNVLYFIAAYFCVHSLSIFSRRQIIGLHKDLYSFYITCTRNLSQAAVR